MSIPIVSSLIAEESEVLDSGVQGSTVFDNNIQENSINSVLDDDILPMDESIKYSLDNDGNIRAPQVTFDGEEICFLLRNKIHSPKEQWLRKVNAGIIVYFAGDKNAQIGKSIPEYLSITDCIEIVCMVIQNTLGFYPPAGKNISDPPFSVLQKRIPSDDELDFFSWSMEILHILHRYCPKNKLLLPNSPITRIVIRSISTRIMVNIFSIIEKFSKFITLNLMLKIKIY